MSVTTAAEPGVVWGKRSSFEEITSLLRNPIDLMPAEAFTERLVLTRTFGKVRAYVCDPALVRELLVGHADDLEKSAVTKRLLSPALGEGLLTAEGKHWRWQRQAVAPGFRPAALSSVLPDMIEGGLRTRDRWLKKPAGARVDLLPEMIDTTFEIILDTMLSGPSAIDSDAFERDVNDYLALTPWMFAQALIGLPQGFPHPGSKRARKAVADLKASVRKMLNERRAADTKHDLVDTLMTASDPETGRRMTDEEIIENTLSFVIAGHETTASALTWTLGILARHPEHQDAIAEEVRRVTGGGVPTPEQITELDFTTRVASEAMRVYPPAGMIARRTLRDITLAGTTIPADSTAIVPIYAIHHNPKLWPDPEAFRPERFSPAESEGRSRFAYLPFGAGPRICIGNTFALNEAVAVLAILVSAFRIKSLGPLPKPVLRVTMRPVTPLEVEITPRT